jgi:hypothetical protein
MESALGSESSLSRLCSGLKLTAGLKSPPLIRKNTHAFTARENPKARLIYSNCAGFFCCVSVMTVVPVLVFDATLATCVPAKAKNRNEMVPQSSPKTATIWPLADGGRDRSALVIGERSLWAGASAFIFVAMGWDSGWVAIDSIQTSMNIG